MESWTGFLGRLENDKTGEDLSLLSSLERGRIGEGFDRLAEGGTSSAAKSSSLRFISRVLATGESDFRCLPRLSFEALLKL